MTTPTSEQFDTVLDLIRSEAKHDWVNLSDIQSVLATVFGDVFYSSADGLETILFFVESMLNSGEYCAARMDSNAHRGRVLLSESTSDTLRRIRAACATGSVTDNAFVGLFEPVESATSLRTR